MTNKIPYIFFIIILFVVLAGNYALGYTDKGTIVGNKRATIVSTAFLVSNQSTGLNLPERTVEANIAIPEKTLKDILLPVENIEAKKSALCDYLQSEKPDKFNEMNFCKK